MENRLLFRAVSPLKGTVLNKFDRPSSGDFWLFADEYHRAGRLLVNQREIDKDAISDYKAYPILFLYRHAAELHLKAILWRTGKLAPFMHSTGSSHDLIRMLDMVKEFVNDELGWETHTISELEPYFRELNTFDKRSDCFRYPVDKKLKPNIEPRLTFSVRDFAKEMDEALGLLSGMGDSIDEAFNVRAEIAWDDSCEDHGE